MAKPVDELTVRQQKAAKLGETLYEDKELTSNQFASFDEDNFSIKRLLLQMAYFAFAICVPVTVFLVVLWFSESIQVNPHTGLLILIRIGCLIVACVLLIKYHLLTILGVVPLILYGMLWVLSPAFDFWLSHL
jgi:hypothetical protein